MPIHDPHLPIDLPDLPRNGAAVHTLGAPPHLFDDEAVAVLREQLISHLGADMARGLITAWGYELGRRDALSLGRHFSWENDTQLLLCGPRLQPLMHAGRMETKRLQLNRAQGVVDVEVVWHRCPEAAQYIERLGHAEHAVCWTLVGYYAGYCSTLLCREVQAIETTCAGMGADFCTVRLRGREPSAAGRLHPSLQPSHAVRIMQQELERLRFESSMRLQRLEALREAVLDVAGELMLDGVQAKIVSRGRVLLGARYGFLALFQESDVRHRHLGAVQRGYVIIHDGLSQSDAADLDPFPITAGLFGAVLRDSTTVRVRRIGDDPRSRGMPAHPALSASFLGVPVRVHGQLHGALYFTDRLDGGEFSLDDEKLAESFAAHAGVALENARLVETIDAERGELAHALEREQEVTSELHHVRSEQERERNLLAALLTLPDVGDVDSALHRVLGRLTSLLDADVGSLSLCGEDGALQVRAMTERGQAVDLPPGDGQGGGQALAAGFSGRVTEARDVVYVRDVVEDPAALEPHLRDRGVRTLLGAPLLCEGRLIGVVAVGSFAVRTFDEAEWRFLRVAANLTALSIERARLHGEVVRSDQLLRAVIEAAPIGMSVTVPPRGEMILSNEVMRRLSELAAQSGAQPAGDAPERALAGEVVRRVERALVCPITGSQVAVRVSAAPVRSAAGPNGPGIVQAAVTVVEDLTLEKEIERLRERFVQLVAHDLRNPLNAAMMHVEILRERLEGALTPAQAAAGVAGGAAQLQVHAQAQAASGALAEGIRTAEAISRAMDRVGELVSDLLDYSRLEAGQLMVHRAQVALRPLLRELLDEMRPLLGDRPLELEIAEDLPPLWADRRRLAQVLMNLLSNAAKYTPPDARMGLRARLCDPIEAAFLRPLDEEGAGRGQAGGAQGERGGAPRNWVLISVWDLGPGIPQEARVRLFDPFYRLTRDVERREGTGLGLYIARGLVETHGGQIWIEDTEGACFSMLWPAAIKE
jgi:signal transduction histidine kinase/predicted hydrocarbon binding protein